MEFIQSLSRRPFLGNNRNQRYFSSSEDQVVAYNPVRLIDAFIDKLEMTASITIIQINSVLKMQIM
jgi:hypothetical protein